jgi:hypothetical protein
MCKWRMLDSFAQHQIVDAMTQHKQRCENWNYGNVRKYWMDKDENGSTVLCVEYEKGTIWHYQRSAGTALNIY